MGNTQKEGRGKGLGSCTVTQACAAVTMRLAVCDYLYQRHTCCSVVIHTGSAAVSACAECNCAGRGQPGLSTALPSLVWRFLQ